MNDKICVSRWLLRLGFFGLVLGAAAVVAVQLPELRREIKIMNM